MTTTIRAMIALLFTSLLLWGCTSEQGPGEGAREPEADSSGAQERDFVGNSSIQLPASWSYDLARQGGDSWQFSISPQSFNIGSPCKRNGPLSEKLLARAGVFITGFAYVAALPGAAERYKQDPGKFLLDRGTLASYETLGCRPTYRTDFELKNYYVTVHMAVSDDAHESTVNRALQALNSIH